MKLLLVQAGFGAGGAEKIVAMIARHRQALGDEVSVLAFHMPPDGSYFPYPEGIRLISPEPGEVSGQVQRMKYIRKVLRDMRPDCALSFLTKINVLTLIAGIGTGVPVIISERNNPKVQSAHPLWPKLQEWLGPRAASIVMQTERARDDLPPAPRRKASVIHNPCKPLEVDRVPGEGRGVRLVAVGRLDRQKGFDMLIEAMPAVLAVHPDTTLVIHGEGPVRVELEGRIEALGLGDAVALPGNSPVAGDWLARADILVAPSRFEGFPNVVAEAAVSGLPIVAFDCDYGPREIIRPRENGLLVENGNVGALTEALNTLIGDPALREEMTGNAAESVAALAPESILSQWDALIARSR